MNSSPRIKQRFSAHSLAIILEFIKTLPIPDADVYRFYKIVTQDGMKTVVWGYNEDDVLARFNEFAELLIFM